MRNFPTKRRFFDLKISKCYLYNLGIFYYNESTKDLLNLFLEDTYMSIGKNIATFRKAKGFTQTELGEMMGVSNQAVSKWETGVSHS